MNIKLEVQMNNEVRKYINKVAKRITPTLTPFIGKKIIRADSTLIKKLDDLIEWPQGIKVKAPAGYTARVFRPYVRIYHHSIQLHSRICFTAPAATPRYVSEDLTIADITDRTLLDVTNAQLPTHSPSKEALKYQRAVRLKGQYHEATSRLGLYIHREAVRR